MRVYNQGYKLYVVQPTNPEGQQGTRRTAVSRSINQACREPRELNRNPGNPLRAAVERCGRSGSERTVNGIQREEPTANWQLCASRGQKGR